MIGPVPPPNASAATSTDFAVFTCSRSGTPSPVEVLREPRARCAPASRGRARRTAYRDRRASRSSPSGCPTAQARRASTRARRGASAARLRAPPRRARQHAQEQLGARAALLAQRLVDRGQSLGLGGGVVEADDREVARHGRGRARAAASRAPSASGSLSAKIAVVSGRAVEQRVRARAAALDVADLALLDRDGGPVDARRLGRAPRALEPPAGARSPSRRPGSPRRRDRRCAPAESRRLSTPSRRWPSSVRCPTAAPAAARSSIPTKPQRSVTRQVARARASRSRPSGGAGPATPRRAGRRPRASRAAARRPPPGRSRG